MGKPRNTLATKKQLERLFTKGETAEKAREKMMEKYKGFKLSMKFCNQFFIEFWKKQNDKVRLERVAKASLDQTLFKNNIIKLSFIPRMWRQQKPRIPTGITAPLYGSESKQKQLRKGAALKKRIWKKLKRRNLEKQAIESSVSDDMINEVISVAASVQAKRIFSQFRKRTSNQPVTQGVVVVNILSEDIHISFAGREVCRFRTLPYGCEYRTTERWQYKYHRTKHHLLALATLIELFKVKALNKTSLRFELGVGKNTYNAEETDGFSYDFMSSFVTSKALTNTSKTTMVILMDEADFALHDRIKNLMGYTNMWVRDRACVFGNVSSKIWRIVVQK
ncbi:hypothetical protein CAEBREN_17662 [Caenorhabditis brenneri]|uniref:Uncharacterized protein n=1 Tax=Caenorhabditis brenneri TaxID=135651 RepID=G0MX58_CAEBE|nr:hypothetical protein CAEBREN_17662 [Caenorhabditis brenneri]